MQVGLVGLGKMGWNLLENMLSKGIDITAFDSNDDIREKLMTTTARSAGTLKELVNSLSRPRIIWLMVPAGEATQDCIDQLSKLLNSDDILIDGGNSYYKDSIKHFQSLSIKKIHFFDVGTSGGISGARNGGNFMIGGPKEIFSQIDPLFKKISVKDGYMYTGATGSGHFLKMVHNGIEYGMMQAIGEGFEILDKSRFNYNNEAVAQVWNNGSVIRSWLIELAQKAFSEDKNLKQIKGIMYSSGEGAWTIEEAIRLHVPTPVISSALMMRYRSEEDDAMAGKVVAALRNEFGGHPMDKV